MNPNTSNKTTWLSGHMLLMGATLVINILIVGYIYRYHQHELSMEQKTYYLRSSELDSTEHTLKQEIIALEGVQTWEDTGFTKSQVK